MERPPLRYRDSTNSSAALGPVIPGEISQHRFVSSADSAGQVLASGGFAHPSRDGSSEMLHPRVSGLIGEGCSPIFVRCFFVTNTAPAVIPALILS